MLRISLLGEQTIFDTTGSLRTRSSRTVALVGHLVSHTGSPQPRQRIAGLFWPDSADAQALTNLRRELHHLRQLLGDDESLLVTSTDLTWRDRPTCRVDVRVFAQERAAALAASGSDDMSALTHARAAMAEYRGAFLPGVYDDWAVTVRDDLERDCVELCDLVSATAARLGQGSVAVEAARRRIDLSPLDEHGYRVLMRLQAELGNRAGAISTYHHCASVLERELGIDPDQSTTKLLHELLGPGTQSPRPAKSAVPRQRSGPAGAGLVGRAEQLGVLRSLWSTVQDGQPVIAAVRGEAGMGKTRLVTELAAVAAREGAVVATSQCFGTSGRLSLAPVADWLRQPSIRTATERLAPVWRAEVERLVPTGWQELPSQPSPSRVMVDAWQRHRFFEGLARSLLEVGRPTLLVLDNLQWCDEETLAFLTFLMGFAGDAPLMLGLTVRDRGDPDDLRPFEWLTRMQNSGLLTELSIGPLDVDQTAELAGALTGRTLAPTDAQLIHATTGGFPLYVVEAARTTTDLSGSAAGDGSLTDVLTRRLRQTTPEAAEVGALAAALGRDFSLPLLTEASDLDPDSVVRAVDELWRSRIIREFKEGYDFSHDLLREAAYARVSPPRRWLLHRRLAQGMELVHAGNTDEVAAQLAEQYWRAGNHERALTYYRRAGDVATAMFAHAEAIRHHRKTLELLAELPPGRNRDERELDCLQALAPEMNALWGYSSAALQEVFERLVVVAELLQRPKSMVNALVGLWASRYVQGRTRESAELAQRLLDLVGTDEEQLGRAHLPFAGSALHLGQPRLSVQHFDLGLASVGDEVLSFGTRASVHAGAWSAHSAWILGDSADAARRCETALAEARASGHPYSLAVALAYAGISYQLLGDRQRLAACVAELRGLCERYEFAYYSEWGRILEGWSVGGPAGLALIQQGIGTLKSQGAFARMPYWLGLLADTLDADPEAARATLDAAIAASHAHDDLWWLPELLRRRAAFDPAERAAERLGRAIALARKQESEALLQRCERDLEALRGGVPSLAGSEER